MSKMLLAASPLALARVTGGQEGVAGIFLCLLTLGQATVLAQPPCGMEAADSSSGCV